MRTRVAGGAAWLFGLALLAGPRTVRGERSPDETSTDEKLQPRRYEFLPVPIVGGNSDVGIEIGVAFTLARFNDEERPYRWLIGGVLSTSLKNDESGFRAVQQYHALRLDLPNLLSGRVRVDSRINFTRNIEAPYYGIGNASAIGGLADSDSTRQNQYLAEEMRLRSLVRVKTSTPFEAALSINLRYEMPETYPASRLSVDRALAGIPGTESAFLSTLGAGVIVDTRDNEFVPREGVFVQLGAAGTIGTAERVAYAEFSGVFATYLPLGSAMTLATRAMASFQLGRVPFYDLQQGGVFNQQYMVGSALGVRGVPLGRYAGKVKALANAELRTMFIPRFRIARWRILVGTTTFFDAGRVWSDYGGSPRDGDSLGIKFGCGGGLFFQWDQSSIFRVEAAYSPDRGGSNPVAYYLNNGLVF